MSPILLVLICLALLALGLWLLARRAPAPSEAQQALEEAHRYHERAARIVERAWSQYRPLTPGEQARYNRHMARRARAMRTYDRVTREEHRV